MKTFRNNAVFRRFHTGVFYNSSSNSNFAFFNNLIIFFVFGNQILWMLIALLYQLGAQNGFGPAIPKQPLVNNKFIYWHASPLLMILLYNAFLFLKLLKFLINKIHMFAIKGLTEIIKQITDVALFCILPGYLIGRFLPDIFLSSSISRGVRIVLVTFPCFCLLASYLSTYPNILQKQTKALFLHFSQGILTIFSLFSGARILAFSYENYLFPLKVLIHSFDRLEYENVVVPSWWIQECLGPCEKIKYCCFFFSLCLCVQYLVLSYQASSIKREKCCRKTVFSAISAAMLYLLLKSTFLIMASLSTKKLDSLVTMLEGRQGRRLNIESLQNSFHNNEKPNTIFWDNVCRQTQLLICNDEWPFLVTNYNESIFNKSIIPEELLMKFRIILENEAEKSLSALENLFSMEIPPYYKVCNNPVDYIDALGSSYLLKFFQAEKRKIDFLLERNSLDDAFNKFQLLHHICCQFRFGGKTCCFSNYFKMLKITSELRNHIITRTNMQDCHKSKLLDEMDDEISSFDLLKKRYFNDMVIEYIERVNKEMNLDYYKSSKFVFPFSYWCCLQLKLNLTKMFFDSTSLESLEIMEEDKPFFLYVSFLTTSLVTIHPFDSPTSFRLIHSIDSDYSYSKKLKHNNSPDKENTQN